MIYSNSVHIHGSMMSRRGANSIPDTCKRGIRGRVKDALCHSEIWSCCRCCRHACTCGGYAERRRTGTHRGDALKSAVASDVVDVRGVAVRRLAVAAGLRADLPPVWRLGALAARPYYYGPYVLRSAYGYSPPPAASTGPAYVAAHAGSEWPDAAVLGHDRHEIGDLAITVHAELNLQHDRKLREADHTGPPFVLSVTADASVSAAAGRARPAEYRWRRAGRSPLRACRGLRRRRSARARPRRSRAARPTARSAVR